MIVQWLRAAREDPATRASSLRFALGIGVCQVGWLLRLALPPPLSLISFVVLAVAEMVIPWWAERAAPTPWHPAHIAERFGLFTIIVLGECVLAATATFQAAIVQGGFSIGLLATGIGGLLLVFALWWSYFKSSPVARLRRSMTAAFIWGYGHYPLCAAVAALGVGLQVATETTLHLTHVSDVAAALTVAIPVIAYLVVLAIIHAVTDDDHRVDVAPIAVTVVLMFLSAMAATLVPLPIAVLMMGVLGVGLVAVYVYRTQAHAMLSS
jgi:low temperature requirement protein LtrA